MTFPAVAIANAFIDIGKQNYANDLTPMKLQKLVYFAHGWNLGATGNPLINEQVEAWQYGPVVRSIYDVAKQYGNRAIDSYLTVPVPTPNGSWAMFPLLLNPHELSQVKPLLDWIWSQYGQYSGIQLSNLTHEPNTPWANTIAKYNNFVPYSTDINEQEIRQHFSEKMAALSS